MSFIFSQMIYRCFKNSGTALNSIEINAKAQLGLIYSLSWGNLQLIRTRIAFRSAEMQPLLVWNIATFTQFLSIKKNNKLDSLMTEDKEDYLYLIKLLGRV